MPFITFGPSEPSFLLFFIFDFIEWIYENLKKVYLKIKKRFTNG